MQSKKNDIHNKTELNTPEFVAKLYNSYGKKLYAYAMRNWSVSDDEAWDLVYKTLYRVMETHKEYNFANEEKFGSFIFKIFINYLRNHYRDTKKEKEHMQFTGMNTDELKNTSNDNSTNVSTDPRMQALNEELEKMEDWQRMLLLMRSEGRPYSEIAKYIEKPEEQLKVYYQRLKETITKKMYERV